MSNVEVRYSEGSPSFSIAVVCARGIARASRNHIVRQIVNGSYLAEIKSEPAPEDRFPRRRWASLPLRA